MATQARVPVRMLFPLSLLLAASAAAEIRCVRVTTGAKAVTYDSRIYVCATPEGTLPEQHNVSPQLGPTGMWRVPPNTTSTRYFDVPCSAGKVVIQFVAGFAWDNAACLTINGAKRVPLGTVTTELACLKDPPPPRGSTCNIFTCASASGQTVACLTPIDADSCQCLDPLPPTPGVDFLFEGSETDTPPLVSVPTVSAIGLGLVAAALALAALLALRRRARTPGGAS